MDYMKYIHIAVMWLMIGVILGLAVADFKHSRIYNLSKIDKTVLSSVVGGLK